MEEKKMSHEVAAPELRPDPSWPERLAAELAESASNGCVGTELVSETDRVRVWSLRLAPGQRIGFHRHVLDYFWTVLSDGVARSHYNDGRSVETSYRSGDTRHMTFASGQSMIHDLENVGDTELIFTTVEFMDSANPALVIPQSVRRSTTGEPTNVMS
jgi:beta-alanine degradation protein BauB